MRFIRFHLCLKAPAILLLLLWRSLTVCAQTAPAAAIAKIANSITAFNTNTTAEKLYLQTDKNTYYPGDTLWFKGYVFNATYLCSSDKSGLFYLEIANDNNIVIKRVMVHLYLGLGWGNIPLDEKNYGPGTYTIRAYTNWMRNFDEHYIFKKQFTIKPDDDHTWLVTSRYHINSQGDKQSAAIGLRLTNIKGAPLTGLPLMLKLMEGNKVLTKDKATTFPDGSLDLNFELPDKFKGDQLSLVVADAEKDQPSTSAIVPIIFNRKAYTDLQFMPEGGDMVAGLKTHIGFKAIAEDGTGTNVSGSIVDSEQREVATFNSTHLGMGAFDLLPKAGEQYTAVLKLPDNTIKRYPLPEVKNSGLVLSVPGILKDDSITVSIAVSNDLQNNTVYYLIGQARGITCYGAVYKPVGGVKKIRISKSLFPTGIARFTLLNERSQAVNDRIVFIDHHDNLRVNIAANKKLYLVRDSIGMAITAVDISGKPVSASFSISVTDDMQVKTDVLKSGNMLSNLLLTSDLKGSVEDPGYYFGDVDETRAEALDDLMLTQGWVGNSWTEVLNDKRKVTYDAEKVFAVKGKVTNVFNSPIAGTGVVLLSKDPLVVKDTVTNKAGEFIFCKLYPGDTAIYTIQARNKSGKSFNVGVDVEEFKPPVFSNVAKSSALPWNVTIDSTLQTNNTGLVSRKDQYKLSGANQLKEVIITDKKIVKGSMNLNGDGGSDFALNSQDMKKAGKATLLDVLFKNVKGFKKGGIWIGKGPAKVFVPIYQVNTQFVVLIIDGINTAVSRPMNTTWIEYFEELTKGITAEDIKGVEVMESPQYTNRYSLAFVNGPLIDPTKFAFIEVTTYSGKGPNQQNTPGVYLYRPLGFSSAKQFYSPKYLVGNSGGLPDTRQTVYWNPNVVTDNNGKALLSFYTADKPGTYTVTIEGSDMNGNIMSTTSKLVVR